MNIKTQTGFTIIEVIIVLAISSALATSIVIWQGSINDRVRFTNAMEDLNAKLSELRTSVFSTVNENQTDDCQGAAEALSQGGSDPNCVMFAVAVQFNEVNPGQARVRPILANRAAGSEEVLTGLRLAPSLSSIHPLKWGVRFDGGTRGGNPINTIVLTRNFHTGDLEIFTMDVPLSGLGLTDFDANYTAAAKGSAEFNFTDPSGQTASICVNETQNSITRSFSGC